MREDPLRRFALGITIENTSMRLWYSSRAFLVASEPVDFLTVRYLIVLRFVFHSSLR